jgi:hypothetical protein
VKAEPETATPPAGRIGASARTSEARRYRAALAVPDLLAAGAVLVSGVLLLHWLSRITFWHDEWGILLQRRGWGIATFLDPAVEHLIALPILIYKVLLEVAGMNSPLPFQVVAVFTFLLSVVLLYIYVRARIGGWLALAAILPVLFLGPSWDDLLFPYQMTFFGSVSCGIGALFALERRSSGGDLVAMLLLVASLLFSDLGIPFVAGAAVEVMLDRRRLRRVFVVAVPTLIWLAWYLGWGHTAHTFVSFRNLANAPSYVLDGLASSLATLVGLNSPRLTQTSALDWGRPLLVVAIGLAGWRIYRLHRPSDRALAALTILLGFWSLTALNASVFSLPTVGRYQYIGIVLLLIAAAELVRGLQVQRWAAVALLAVAIASALANFSRLRDAANGLAGIAQEERGALAGLELARGEVRPSFERSEADSPAGNFLGFLDAGAYFSAVDAYGSPAYTPEELAESPERARVAADEVLAAALDVKLVPAPREAGPCEAARVAAGASVVGPVPAAGLILRRDSGSVRAALRRYASGSFPVELGPVPRGGAVLRIPADRSSRPWTLELRGKGRASVCNYP